MSKDKRHRSRKGSRSRKRYSSSASWIWISFVLTGILLLIQFKFGEDPAFAPLSRRLLDFSRVLRGPSVVTYSTDNENLQVTPTGHPFSAQFVEEAYHKLVVNYLKPFKHGIDRSSFYDILKRRTYNDAPQGAGKGQQTVLFQIIKGRIYIHDPYKVPSDEKPFYRTRINELLWLLNRLVERGLVSDTEFLVAVHDCVQTTSKETTFRVAQYAESNPVFTIVGCNFSHNIPIPMWEGDSERGGTYANWDENMRMYGLDDLDWSGKLGKAVFRGGVRTSMYFKERGDFEKNCDLLGRSKLMALAQQNPDLLDVSVEGRCGSQTYSMTPLDPREHHKFRYIIYAEGNCFWADRINRQLFGPSAILKQLTPCGQFYEPLLSPMGHYLPVDFFMNNVTEQILWSEHNPEHVQEIVKNANDFAWSFLSTEGILKYMEILLREYTSLLQNRTLAVEPDAKDWTGSYIPNWA